MAAGRAVAKRARVGLLDSRYVGASYASPSFSGFKVKGMIVNDKQDQNKDVAGALDLTGQEIALEFNQGPLAAAASYGMYTANSAAITDGNMQSKNRIDQGSTTPGINTVSGDTTGEYKQKMTSLNASYDLGMAKLFYKYGHVETNNQTTPTATSNGEATTNVFGVRLPFGQTTLLANYAMGDYVAIGNATSYDDSGYQVGLEYALSKRTKAYAIYGATETDKTAILKEKDTQIAIGLIHNF
jgi:predicted porin